MGDSTLEEDILTTVLFSKLESDWETVWGTLLLRRIF